MFPIRSLHKYFSYIGTKQRYAPPPQIGRWKSNQEEESIPDKKREKLNQKPVKENLSIEVSIWKNQPTKRKHLLLL